MENKILPLEGMKVVDLSTIVAAPTVAELLCIYGADVIKVEAPRGDGERTVYRFLKTPGEDDFNPLYTLQNSNKRHICLDLKTEKGMEIMKELLADADVFVTNVRPQGLARLGLDYDTIAPLFPRLIYAHLFGYGPKGPNKDDPGFDSTVFWLRGGMTADWQVKDARYPFRPTYAFGDTATASALFGAVLTAYIGREKTGKGTKVETSLYSSGIWCNGQGIIQTQFEKTRLNPEPEKNTDPLKEFYLCQDDRWFSLDERRDYETDWPIMAPVLGLEDLLADERFASRETLIKDDLYVELRNRMTEVFKTKPSTEWKQLFQAISMPCDIAVPTCEVRTDEQARVNDYLEDVTFPNGETVTMPVPPMVFSEYGKRSIKPTGGIGDCTDEVLASLGYSDADIAALRENNIVK